MVEWLLSVWGICLAGAKIGVGFRQEGRLRQMVVATGGFVDPTKGLNLILKAIGDLCKIVSRQVTCSCL